MIDRIQIIGATENSPIFKPLFVLLTLLYSPYITQPPIHGEFTFGGASLTCVTRFLANFTVSLLPRLCACEFLILVILAVLNKIKFTGEVLCKYFTLLYMMYQKTKYSLPSFGYVKWKFLSWSWKLERKISKFVFV